MTTPLTREEVSKWPALGPMNLDPARVLALLDERDALRDALAAATNLRMPGLNESANAERDALLAERRELRVALTAMLDCISTDPMMDGSERNPGINDRRCMLVAIRVARALLAKTERTKR